jgi:Zn-dependent protease with chaperone function
MKRKEICPAFPVGASIGGSRSIHRVRISQQGFDAELFHPSLGNEVVVGRIYLDTSGLAFRADNTDYDVPLDQLTVEIGDDRIFFHNALDPEARIFTRNEAVLDVPCFADAGNWRQRLQRTASRHELKRRLRITGYAVAGCFLIGWLCVLATHYMVRSLVAKVPPEWEQSYGDEQIAELKSAGMLLDDSNRVARLTALVAPLLKSVPGGAEFKFHIMESEMANAFAVPGGHVVVTTRLLEIADNREIIGVIAHESAHLTEKHHAREIISAAGPAMICGTFFRSRSGLVSLVGAGSELLLTQGFSQEFETEADEVGWAALVHANLDPRGMISIFQKFKDEDKKEKGARKIPQAFQSHPALDKRIAHLEARWKKLPRQSGFEELPAVDLKPH